MILRRLLEGLWDHNVMIVATSNRSPDDLYLNGLQRELFVPCIELIKSVSQFVASLIFKGMKNFHKRLFDLFLTLFFVDPCA